MKYSEWLEDIKERFAKYQTDYNLNGEDVEWLIQQAEHVEELEEERDEWKDTAQSYYMTNQGLREQNKRYKQALEFYADEENYCVRFEDDYEPILQDNGKTARQALGWEVLNDD